MTYGVAVAGWFLVIGMAFMLSPVPTVEVAALLFGITLVVPTLVLVWPAGARHLCGLVPRPLRRPSR